MDKRGYALILGASSGFGAATAKELAGIGYDIFGVHMDRKATLSNVEKTVGEIRRKGVDVRFFNVNAASLEKRTQVLDEMERLSAGRGKPAVKVVLHSLAFGILKRFVGRSDEIITSAQMDLTLDVMAHSLVYWTQDLLRRGLIGEGSKIFAMTSSGSDRVLPYYGAISAAKAALEAHVRQLAVELSGDRISVNALRAGVTDTPALRKIPGAERLLEKVRAGNPGGRLTTPADVAKVIAGLSTIETAWMTGNVIGVDGGEHLVD